MTMLRRMSVLAVVCGLCVFGLKGNTFAGDKVDLKVGDKAPAFHAMDDQGKVWKSAEHVGKKIIVVYFYPADFTGGCTKQACGFRDDLSKLTGKNVEVVGISGDSVKNHEAFKKFHKLNFTLLADPKADVAKKFGVPTFAGGKATATIGDAKLDFLTDIRIKRWTFIIDLDGKIAYKDTAVNPVMDSQKIQEAVSKLKTK